MSELASTEFRKRFAKLTEPTDVTVNGHYIGRWLPGDELRKALDRAQRCEFCRQLAHVHHAADCPDPEFLAAPSETRLVGMTAQARRDELLSKINRPR